MWAMIATWRMAKEGLESAIEKHTKAPDLIEEAIRYVEDFPYYKSVGYGGLPNEAMVVELDGAFMDGDNLSFGAVGAIKNFKNPISIARRLSKETVNNFLVGEGAEKFAQKEGFVEKDMLSDRAKIHYHNRLKTLEKQEISPYMGHDTVGMVALDKYQSMAAGTSTSGLFMKRSERVGDSPIIGSGLYVDSDIGGASATGLGEDLMKGVVSYEVVRLMKEGYTPQKACEKVVFGLDRTLIKKRGKAGDISVVALNNKGDYGAASNIDNFSFVVITKDKPLTVYQTFRKKDAMHHEVASQKWLDEYMETRTSPIQLKK